MAKSYLEARKALGGRIPIPAADAKPEMWAEVYDKLGRPAKPEEYELPPADLLKGMVLAEAPTKAFLAKAHELGLSKKQASGVLQQYAALAAEAQQSTVQARQQQMEAATQTLRADPEFGGAAFEQNLALTGKAIEKFGGPELRVFLNEHPDLGNNPLLAKAFYRAGKAISDASIHGSQTSAIPTPAEASDDAAKIMMDPAYRDRAHPQHRDTVAKVKRLFELAHPEPG